MTTKQRTNRLWLQLAGGGINDDTARDWPGAHAGFAELVLSALPPRKFAGFPPPQEIEGFEGEVWGFGNEHTWMVDLHAMSEIAMAQFIEYAQNETHPNYDITIQPENGLPLSAHELQVLWPYIREEIKPLRTWPNWTSATA